jgi:hypothetical protein
VITGYVGLIGHGKTMLAVHESVTLARRRGAILASNIEVVAPGVDVVRLSVGDDGLEGVPQLLERAHAEGRGVVMLVDEIGIILPARFWQTGMSIDLMWACSQSRKLAADLIYTAQDVEQVDAFLRRLTDYVTKCRAVPRPSIERREQGKRPWFYRVTRWRPAMVDKPDKRLGSGFVRYRRQWEAAYNTDELVRPPTHLLKSGGRSTRSRQRPIPVPLAIPVEPSPEGPQRSGGAAQRLDGSSGVASVARGPEQP